MAITDEEAGRILPTNINTPENRQVLIAAGVNAGHVAYGIDNILGVNRTNTNLVTQQLFQALIAAGANAQSLGYGVGTILRENDALLTSEIIQSLIAAGGNAQSLAIGFLRTFRANPALVTSENFQALVLAGAHASDIGYGLEDIARTNPSLATQEIFQSLLVAGAAANHVGSGYAALWRAASALATPQNIQALIGIGSGAALLGGCLEIFGQTNSALATQENFEALIGTDVQMVRYGVLEIVRANPALLTQENLNVLIAAGANAVDRAREIITREEISPAPFRYIPLDAVTRDEARSMLRYQDDRLNNEEIITALVSVERSYTQALLIGLERLMRANALTDANRNAIVINVQYAENLARGLEALQSANILTDINRNILLDNVQHSKGLGLGLGALQDANILTDANSNALVANAENASIIGPVLGSMQGANILTQAKFDTIILNRPYDNVGFDLAIYVLAADRILTEDNFDTVIANAQYMDALRGGFAALHGAGIFSSSKFNALIANAQYAERLSNGLGNLVRASRLTDDNFYIIIADPVHAERIAQSIIDGEQTIRPEPLRHIPLDAIPRQAPGNERQHILKELNVDDSDEKINKLIDPITLEAIEYPCKINGDVNRYFEFHTLMALPRARVPLDKEGVTFAPSIIRALEASGGDLQSFTVPETFAHPLTRILHPDTDIIDASIEYQTLFDETVKELISSQSSETSTAKELTPEEMRTARIKRFKPGGGNSGDE